MFLVESGSKATPRGTQFVQLIPSATVSARYDQATSRQGIDDSRNSGAGHRDLGGYPQHLKLVLGREA
jgi:hypothetical protein